MSDAHVLNAGIEEWKRTEISAEPKNDDNDSDFDRLINGIVRRKSE